MKIAFFRLLDYASAGSPGHGPIHLLLQSAEELGFFWDSEQAGWIRPGLPPLRMMTGPIQHFRSAIWQAWQHKVATDLCKRKGFRGGFGVDIYGSHQLLVSSHLRERDKMLLRAILSGGVWNGFLLGKVKKEDVPCRFCGAPDNDGHLFWDCTFPPFVELRNQPEFLPLMSKDRTHWPRCLLWHGWLPVSLLVLLVLLGLLLLVTLLALVLRMPLVLILSLPLPHGSLSGTRMMFKI